MTPEQDRLTIQGNIEPLTMRFNIYGDKEVLRMSRDRINGKLIVTISEELEQAAEDFIQILKAAAEKYNIIVKIEPPDLDYPNATFEEKEYIQRKEAEEASAPPLPASDRPQYII